MLLVADKSYHVHSGNPKQLSDPPPTDSPSAVAKGCVLLPSSGCRSNPLPVLAARFDGLHHINVGNIARDGEHSVIRIKGKGNETRKGVLPPNAATPVNAWLASADIEKDRSGPLFRPGNSARGAGRDGFKRARLSVRSTQELIKKYCRQVGIDEAVSVHSLRVTAATEADKAGVPLIAIQKWLGHKDPRTTLRYIRGHEDLDRSQAYVIRYG